MPWHDRIAPDREDEGGQLTARWYERGDRLEIASTLLRPDGSRYESEWATYGPLTVAEANDVLSAVWWEVAAPPIPLPFGGGGWTDRRRRG